jgi:hypothetical protein
MPPSLTILPITAEHDTQWLPLWLGYQRFYQTNIPDETTQITWQRLLDPQEPMQAALAWLDGVAVGIVLFYCASFNMDGGQLCLSARSVCDGCCAWAGRWACAD